MEKSYKYRIYPNKEQKELIAKTFGCVRFVYNYYLSQRIEKYKEDKETIDIMIKYLHDSQIDELAEKYDLRPGMGMSAVQLGILKRYFVVVNEISDPDDDKKEFETYILINPKMISNSMEEIYVEEGEGCLSVNRPVEGIVPRYARVTMEAYDMEGKLINVRAREELAICFQHELDHLNGILFVDHIDPKNPFKDRDLYRPI